MSSPSLSSASNTPWNAAWAEIQPSLNSLRSAIASWPHSSSRILRVGQLDAELLDQELVSMLKEPVNKALGQLGSVYETRYDPELALLLGAILYKYSVWDDGATYGAKLQDLQYKVARSSASAAERSPSGLPRRILTVHAVLTVLIPYLHTRLRTHALSRAWPDAPSNDRKRHAWDALTRIETVYSTLSLVSFVGFLYNGSYRTLADRILGLRLVPSRSIVRRNVSYEFMNRQMVWHAFTEFLIFLLPIMHTYARKGRLRKRITRFTSNVTSSLRSHLNLTPSSSSHPSASADPASATIEPERHGKYWSLPDDQCAICAESASYDVAHLSEAAEASARELARERDTRGSADRYAHAGRTTNLVASADPAPHEEAPSNNLDNDPIPQFPITTPYVTSCGHTYCYFCVSERIIRASVGTGADADEEGWECLRCERAVRSVERVQGKDEDGELGSQDGLSDSE